MELHDTRTWSHYSKLNECFSIPIDGIINCRQQPIDGRRLQLNANCRPAEAGQQQEPLADESAGDFSLR